MSLLAPLAVDVWKWFTERRADPIPATLTIGGLGVSAIALWWGLATDPKTFGLNVAASLTLIGPGLFLSNVIVKRLHAARARKRLTILLGVVLPTLQAALRTAERARVMLGETAAPIMPPQAAGAATLGQIRTALGNALAALPTKEQIPGLPSELPFRIPLEFPLFPMLLRFIRQMDQAHPLPWTLTTADVADDWSQRCAITFVSHGGQGVPGIEEPVVGLTHIAQQAPGASESVRTPSFVLAVRQSVLSSQHIADSLANELPPSIL